MHDSRVGWRMIVVLMGVNSTEWSLRKGLRCISKMERSLEKTQRRLYQYFNVEYEKGVKKRILFCLLNRKYYVILYRLQSIKFNFPLECEKNEMKIEGKTTLYFYHFRHYIQEFCTASPCFLSKTTTTTFLVATLSLAHIHTFS